MDKVDYKKELQELYQAKPDKPVGVIVPPMNYLMIDGKGDPNTSQEYIDAIQALYPVAYAIKFMCKKDLQKDFIVMPIEGLWWTKDMRDFNAKDKSDWSWTAMIMQPEVVSKDIYERALAQVAEKKSPKALSKLRFETYDEGRAAQVMYVGPYSDEGPTIQALHSFIKEQGGSLDETNKHHHEIYLGDPRRTEPSKLKTIIRQPY
ncbi:MAG: GyrI-like domain-containing protein [Candidatus Saccharimonadales bacterium]